MVARTGVADITYGFCTEHHAGYKLCHRRRKNYVHSGVARTMYVRSVVAIRSANCAYIPAKLFLL